MGLLLYCILGYITTKVGMLIYLYYKLLHCIYSWLLLHVPYWDSVSSVGHQVLLVLRDPCIT